MMHQMTLDELYNVGLHYGHKKEHSTSMTKPYIYAVRDGVVVFDLEKTRAKLEEALNFLKQTTADGQTILFVATKKQAQPLMAALAKTLGMPYMTTRWPGGLLTNFTTVRRSLDQLERLEKLAASPEFVSLKKREQQHINDEMAKLHRAFDGIKDLTKLPEVIFVIDAKEEAIALKEALKLGITTVATVDSDGDPTSIDWVIPANDDAPRGLRYLMQRIGEAVAEGQGKKFEIPENLAVDTSSAPVVKKIGEKNDA